MLTPIGKKIIVKPIEAKLGTLIVTSVKPTLFHVIAVGDEITRIKPNDKIYLEKHYGQEIEHEKEKFLVIEESSILAKLD